MHAWNIPDELVKFIESEFKRFNTQIPEDKVIDKAAGFVLEYVAKCDYYPNTSEEAFDRYRNKRPLTVPECYSILGPAEYLIKAKHFLQVDIVQLHLIIWATLMFCWSQEGVGYVTWWKKSGVGEDVNPKVPVRIS